jgi:uncharacterized protein YukE
MNQFRVEPDQLHGHATTVGSIADQLSAVATGLPDGLAGDALGSFSQFLASGLQGAMAQTMDAIAHASSSVDEMSAGLKRTAGTYQATEDHNTAQLNGEDA